MKKIILVDGNNLLFRSYYATAYNGNFMKNSKDFPTNAIFGFVNMINKILNEENPQYMIVAFDHGKTFRHQKYAEYKGGRMETPEELSLQFPIAKQVLEAMGICSYEIENYEADDIIGTFARYCDEDPEAIGTIISSDRDLLQLLSNDIDIKLLKQKDYIRYNPSTFYDDYGIAPIRIIDLKALQGDASDHIPGVKGIGEKTALKLLQQYDSLEGIYEHIDEIKGKLQERLITDKEMAYFSYELATIVKDVPLAIDMNDILYKGPNQQKLNQIYEELEFYSFLKKEAELPKPKVETEVTILTSLSELPSLSRCAIYLEVLGENYHTSKVLGMGLYDGTKSYFLPPELLKQNPSFLVEIPKITYDVKKTWVALKWLGVSLEKVTFDTMIAASLLDYNIKEDIAYLANQSGYDLPFYETIYGKYTKLIEPTIEDIAKQTALRAQFIYETESLFQEKLKQEELTQLYETIEFPLSFVLADMEYTGVHVDRATLTTMGEEMKIKIELIAQEIYNMAGITFNISSPSQLGDILFERLGLPHGKKNQKGYSTAVEVLNKLQGKHPIIDSVLEYRMLTKLYTTYIEGLKATILQDEKIHTIYTQTLTRTGRLSSVEPNLQNIPIRYEYGRLIRKAFVPSSNSIIISGDYSQIELRVMAHMANITSLIEAFEKDMDIHTKTAMDIFKVSKEEVTSNMRRIAKAVNFGIIYGISSYGLSENLAIPVIEAKEFIENYLATYPGVKAYMDKTIEQAHLDGYVKTLLNRKRTIPELSNKNYMIRSSGERIALNTPIQGTSADIIKKAMVVLFSKLKENNLKSKMILQVHDELVFDCIKEEKEEVIALITEVMEHTFPLSVPLKVDIEYGDNWYQAK